MSLWSICVAYAVLILQRSKSYTLLLQLITTLYTCYLNYNDTATKNSTETIQMITYVSVLYLDLAKK